MLCWPCDSLPEHRPHCRFYNEPVIPHLLLQVSAGSQRRGLSIGGCLNGSGIIDILGRLLFVWGCVLCTVQCLAAAGAPHPIHARSTLYLQQTPYISNITCLPCREPWL